MAATLPSLPPLPPTPSPAATTLTGNLTSSFLSIPPPRPRLAATHRRAVVAAASSRPPPPPSPEGGDEEEEEQEVERAMGMDGGIPGTSGELLRRVSSRAYGMRRHLMESLDALAYDVLETNPWREQPKPVYVLARRDNQLWTMKTRRNRSEVERELGMLFSKGGGSGVGTKSKYSGSKFSMLVEDVTEGVLVFEDEDDAVNYCDLLQGCEGIAEIEASSVFNLCRQMKALAVLFRRGRTPPTPQSLERDLRARNRSLED
ncbi:hypothetical protein ACQ4PT_000001 [Festuca glaucescens]